MPKYLTFFRSTVEADHKELVKFAKSCDFLPMLLDELKYHVKCLKKMMKQYF